MFFALDYSKVYQELEERDFVHELYSLSLEVLQLTGSVQKFEVMKKRLASFPQHAEGLASFIRGRAAKGPVAPVSGVESISNTPQFKSGTPQSSQQQQQNPNHLHHQVQSVPQFNGEVITPFQSQLDLLISTMNIQQKFEILYNLHGMVKELGPKKQNIPKGEEQILQQTDLFIQRTMQLFEWIFNNKQQIQQGNKNLIQYFLEMLNDTFSSKQILQSINSKLHQQFTELILSRLLQEDEFSKQELSYFQENQERLTPEEVNRLTVQKEFTASVIKSINAAMLKILDNSNIQLQFENFIKLLTKFRKSNQTKHLQMTVKCIVKLTKNLEHQSQNMDLSKLFLNIHEYVITLQRDTLNGQIPSDDSGIKTIRTILNEINKICG